MEHGPGHALKHALQVAHSTLLENKSKFLRYNMKSTVEENVIPVLHEIFRVVSRFPATFYVISRKVDYFWVSV